jgi:hypothetical protein
MVLLVARAIGARVMAIGPQYGGSSQPVAAVGDLLKEVVDVFGGTRARPEHDLLELAARKRLVVKIDGQNQKRYARSG